MRLTSFTYVILIFVCIGFVFPIQAQDTLHIDRRTTLVSEDNHEQEKDIVDVITDNSVYHALFGNPKPRIESYRPQAALLPAAGYTLQTGFAVVLAGNIQFYSDPSDHSKASGFSTSITYTQKNQLILPFYINIWSKGNRFNFLSDNRYMNYPSQNYGIGPQSKEANGYTIVYSYLKLHEIVSFRIAKNTYLGAGYFYDNFWDINELDAPPPPPDGHSMSLLGKYGKKNHELSSGIVFKPFYDSRPNQINPSKGALASGTFRVNAPFLGSDMPWASAVIEFRKYITFPAAGKNVLAFWNYNWLTMGRAPYLLLPSTGWDDQFISVEAIFKDAIKTAIWRI